MQTSDSQVSVSNREELQTPPPSPRSQKRWWLLLMLLVGAGGVGLGRGLTPASQATAPVAAKPQPPRPIETIALTSGTATRSTSMLGQVEASENATIRTRTSGVVQQVLVQPGDRITPGMVLAILDDTDQRLAVAEARARLAQARSELARLEVGTRQEIIAQRQAEVRAAQAREQEAQDNSERTRSLVNTGALSRRELVEAESRTDAARGERMQAQAELAEATAGPTREEIDAQRANVAAAESALNQAELALQRTRIRAVSSGVIQTRQVSSGDLVESGDEIATKVNGTQLDVFLEVPESLSGSVRAGMPVELTARALPNWRDRTTLTGIVPSADTASRRQRVRVRLSNPPANLLPGMAVQAQLQLPSDTPSFVVPRDALTRRENRWLVFTVADGKARQLEVELVADMGEKMAIANPQLSQGQAIVVRGGDGLKDGAVVSRKS
ncbi:efflux RND transporter periplasmic adaptor subunit [Chroococcidiopsis sp. FACHB-1243]|uniref:efflux RND transporter periplasmic adaptor subunit n=1 Tax=Chroococcidiopsis sp. [FACHB-1243] TaxID=2692781 RepID=UPI0017825380|nr:efflux RND transporter periplasmic adaptor subunit [Chroococcidiopsis sp. [FACHB-1243]]